MMIAAMMKWTCLLTTITIYRLPLGTNLAQLHKIVHGILLNLI